MALQCGIVGLPNVGKSTLFNCLSKAKAQSANYPFCTIEPNIGIISVSKCCSENYFVLSTSPLLLKVQCKIHYLSIFKTSDENYRSRFNCKRGNCKI